ncbi:MAG TPA: hypothetical protein VKY41_06055, partial [Xanthomarina sp.]|nr:hypothetical protein [Xanthomarina sp.]
MFILICSFASSTFSQVLEPFTQRSSQYTPDIKLYSIKGDFTLIGNSNLTVTGLNNSSTNSNTNMVFVDLDGNPSTTNSSSATLTFSEENGANPECSNILFAGLYWSGRGNDSYLTNLQKRTIKLKGPNDSDYVVHQADANQILYPGKEGMYVGFKEVTNQVRNNGLGEYWVADLALSQGNGGSIGYYGGWSLVVIYENSKMNWRDVTIFDGYAFVEHNGGTGSTTAYELPVSGFNAVQAGDVNIKLGLMAGEGDRSISGDFFSIRNANNNAWVSLSHSGNSTNNFFNSSIVTGGNPRTPNNTNNTGLDISMFNLNNTNNQLIANGQTQTRFRYGSNQDTYVIFNMTMSVDAYIPVSEGVLATNTINGVPPSGSNIVVEPGDTIEYGIEIRNKGTEAIENAKLVVPIPFTSTYINPSITSNIYDSGVIQTAPYFDPNEGATGAIVWEFDYLPINTDINTLLADITFKLKATEDCSILVNNNCAPRIVIVGGYISGIGATSGSPYTLPLIQGYQQNGICQGEPNIDPIYIDIDSEQFILDNCIGISEEREFFFCNSTANTIPVSVVSSQFPLGSTFYNIYPLTPSSIQYTNTNPFPATPGVSTYYAVPPGDTTCIYIFTIEVANIETVPTVENFEYCLNEVASPITGTTTNPNHVVLFYTDNNPNTVGQPLFTPPTDTVGEFTYYAAEGLDGNCMGEKVPFTVSVYDNITITEEIINESCTDSSNGSITLNVEGGSGNYTYVWSYNGTIDPSLDSAILTGLTAGTYTVTISDNDTECSATGNYEIEVLDAVAPIITTAPANKSLEGCETSDLINEPTIYLEYSETEVTITEAEFTAEGGGFEEENLASITYLDSASETCPIVVTRTFTLTDNCGATATVEQIITINTPELVINAPDAMTSEACDYADQAAVDAAFNTWLQGFSVTGGCNATGDYGNPTAPLLCEGATTTVTYNVTDICGDTSIERTFTINAPEAVVANAPDSMTSEACDYADQAAVDAAFNTWLQGFSVTGGCNATGDYGNPTAPLLCEGGTTTVTYNISNICGDTSIERTFTVNAPEAVVTNAPDSMTSDACDYTDQAAVDTAFNTWLQGFTVTGGCNATGDYGNPTAPLLCEGGTTTVTYNISDICGDTSIERTFTINAPTAVVANAPDAMTSEACDFADQAAVDTAFNTWLQGFTVTGGCNVTGDYGNPTAPLLCEGGTTTVTYNVTDICGDTSIERTFTINAPEAVVANAPDSMTSEACDSLIKQLLTQHSIRGYKDSLLLVVVMLQEIMEILLLRYYAKVVRLRLL